MRTAEAGPRLGSVMVGAAVLMGLGGCIGSSGTPEGLELVWGEQGIAPGQLEKPRALAIDEHDQVYLVDMTARIQVFDSDGKYLRGWKTPVSKNGRPTGLTIAKDGRLLVADTHYYRVLVYEKDGTPVESATLGGVMGTGPGEFGWVTDVAEDSAGNMYVSEYGDNDRIQKFSRDGDFLLQWGGNGEELGQFRRPQSVVVDEEDRVWVADSCNHRIQVFDTQGKLLFHWGEEGSAAGQLYYPYGIALDGRGHLYVCEYGNHRVQKLSLSGKPLGTWGTNGRGPGELHNPWAVELDSAGRVHVLDSNNHRVQRVRF